MLPRVIIYNAVSLDGNIDLKSADLETYYGLAPVWKEDATLVGSGTILKGAAEMAPDGPGEPEPWKPEPGDRRALLVVPDSRGRVRTWNALRMSGYWRDVLALCSRSTPVRHLERLKRNRVSCIIAGEKKVDLRAALETLRSDFGVRTVRVDSGGILNGILLREGLVYEVALLIHPELAGGKVRPFFAGAAPPAGIGRLRLLRLERVRGGLVWLKYRVLH